MMIHPLSLNPVWSTPSAAGRSLWSDISITLDINQCVRRKMVTVIINLQHIGHKLPGDASKTHVQGYPLLEEGMSTLRPKRLEKRDRSDASMRPKRLKNKTEANARPYSDTPHIFLPSEDGPRSGKCFQDRNVWETQIYPRHFCGL